MLTDRAQQLIDLAKDFAFSGASAELISESILAALGRCSEGVVLVAECAGVTAARVRDACPRLPDPVACPGRLVLSGEVRDLLMVAVELAEGVPDRSHPGLIDLRHLACAIALSHGFCAALGVSAPARDVVLRVLASWYDAEAPALEEITARLETIRTELLARVYGQDHAVHTFVEGLFNAEVVAAADRTRRAPRAIFVFAGPPGVGKTYLAETGAARLGRPFKRFDMAAFSSHHQHDSLIGISRSYQGAHPGLLTEFVEKNPNAILLFDEIEKAHANTIHLFLQILDAGRLEDKYLERDIAFRDTIVIFTTNAGRMLYDRPNTTGVHAVNAAFHRGTILDALENERNPQTGQPFFPAAICSRMATGYPVLFNHLGVNDLERVIGAELTRLGELLERQYYKPVSFHPLLPMCLVLREGARSDARTLRAQAETFLKTELFRFCRLFETEHLAQVMEKVESIRIELDTAELSPEIAALFEPPGRPSVLLAAPPEIGELYRDSVPGIDWLVAGSQEEAMRLLAGQDPDLVLLDLWIGRAAASGSVTLECFDRLPAGSRAVDEGQKLLRAIRERLPEAPVFLLSTVDTEAGQEQRPGLAEELFLECVRAGGARGVIPSRFIDGLVEGWQEHRDEFAARVIEIARRLHREKAAARLGRERKVLSFETVPRVSGSDHGLAIRLRHLRLARAVAAADAGEVLSEVERPTVRFEDVIGADEAKRELRFFTDYLKAPRRFAALGLKPPRGVLLYGPPGTGKTMLARAMAGESDVAFIPAVASSFVTKWQGSGPQSVRDLFDRARRYAPAIVFIDEIDVVGRVRSGSTGAGHGEEAALNALLTEMDGFSGATSDRPVFVLAATNFRVKAEDQDSPERSARTLDPALVRRFSRLILVDLPDTAARRRYLTLRLKEGDPKVIDLIAEKSVGASISDLERVIDSARRAAFERGVPVSAEMALESLDTVNEGEARPWSPQFLESTARHEAGHTILYWLSGWWAPEVSIIARGNHGGGMRRAEAEMKRESLTREDLLANIRTCLGGRAAEILHSGSGGLTTGASGDMEQATRLARQMICRYGMNDAFGLLSAPELLSHPEALGSPLYARVCEAAASILDGEMKRSLELLAEHRDKLDRLAASLCERNRLYRSDLEQLLPAPPVGPLPLS